jgi:hypothetical protein
MEALDLRRYRSYTLMAKFGFLRTLARHISPSYT